MAKTGIHFKPCNVSSVEAHNERTQSYLNGVRRSGRDFYFFPDLTCLNQSLVNPEYENLSCAEIFEKQKDAYARKTGQRPNLEDRIVTNKKTGKQRTISGWSPIREGVVPIKEDTKMEDFAPFIDWCSSCGLNVIRIDLHFDEGYENSKGERTFNRHAHIVVDWLDWETGKTAKLDASKMSQAQDVIADALKMQRGKKKIETGTVHLNPAEFREKIAEEYAIRLETENQKLSEENKRLKEDNETLRQANTGITAKYLDYWKYKGRAKKAEATLEAEKAARNEDALKFAQEISWLKKALENEKKRASSAEYREGIYKDKIQAAEDKAKKATIRADHWKNEYDSLKGREDQGKGMKR